MRSLPRQSIQECVLAELPSGRGNQMGEAWKRRLGEMVKLYVRLNLILCTSLLAIHQTPVRILMKILELGSYVVD